MTVRLPGGTAVTVGGPAGGSGHKGPLQAGSLGTAGGGGLVGGGAVAGGGHATNPALDALSVYSGPGGGPGAPGAGGGTGGGLPGGGSGGVLGGGGGAGLPAAMSATAARHLRSTLELLEACMSSIAPIDRQVLGMRAGSPGVAPLSRSQVATQLGVSKRQVRLSERRGLSGLRTAAEQTGCAGPVGGPFSVAGVGMLPLAAPVYATEVVATQTVAARGDGGSGYVPAREASPGAPSPLSQLADSGQSGPAWLVILFTVLFSVSIAGLMRELRHSVGA